MAGKGSTAGARRGRYNDGDEKPESTRSKTSPLALKRAKIEALVDRIRAESPLKYDGAKEIGARAIRALLIEQERLERLSRSGKITAEEAKSVSSVASNTRRWFETLGVVELLDPDDDEDGL